MQDLIKDVTTEGYWPLQGQVFFSLFDRYIPFFVEDAAPIEYVIACAEYLNAWSDETIEALCQACIRYCADFRDMVGEDPIEFASPRDVLKLVQPSSLIIPNPAHPEPVGHLEFNCDWEEEHGMEWNGSSAATTCSMLEASMAKTLGAASCPRKAGTMPRPRRLRI